MKINLLAILMLFAFNVKAQVSLKELNKGIQAYIEKADFNGRIILWENDDIVLDHTYGYASFEQNQLIDSLTCFNVASVGKMITSLGILKLVDGGKLSLQDKINTYYPSLPSEITIEQLLNHTSGLQKRIFVLGHNWKNLGKSTSIDEFIDFLSKESIRFKAGEKFEYNNVNYILLYDLHKKITGKSIEEAMKEEGILFSLDQTTRANRYDFNEATGQWIYDETMVGNLLASNEYSLLGPGHYYINPIEGIRIIDAFKTSISKDLLNKATTPGIDTDKEGEKYGFGIALKEDSQGYQIWSHLGKNYGSRAYLAYYKKRDVTLFMVTNINDPNFNMFRPKLEAVISDNKPFEMPKLSLANELRGYIPYLDSDEIRSKFFDLKVTDEYYISRIEINDIAYHLWEQNQKSKGIEILAINAVEFPDNHRARYYYADGLHKLGDYSKAIIEYKEAIKVMKNQLGEDHGWVKQAEKELKECESKTSDDDKLMEDSIAELSKRSNQLQIQVSQLELIEEKLKAHKKIRN